MVVYCIVSNCDFIFSGIMDELVFLFEDNVFYQLYDFMQNLEYLVFFDLVVY